MQKLVGMVIVALVLAAAALPTNARQGIKQGRSNLPAPPVTQQLLFITQYSPLETVGGAGSANRVIFRFVPGMWPPEPPYSGGGFALSGGDAGLFHVDPNSGLLSIGSTDVAASGTPYQFNVTVNGTHVTPVGVLVRPAGTAWIEVDNWNPIAGSSITATVHDSPNPPGQPGGGDIIAVDWATGIRSAYWPSNSPHLPPGTHELTHTFFLPDSGGDEISYLRVLQFTENVGGVQTGPIVLRPTAPVTPAPTAPNTLSDPFVPLHTYTVCLGGTCDFADWADALRAASGQDYVKIVIGQGAYVNCYAPNVTAESNMPHHLWIKGTGGNFPVLGWGICQDKATIVWGSGNTAGDGSALYIDNVRITNSACGGSGNGGGIRADGPGDFYLRNVFITATCMGFISGFLPGNITIQNSRFARDGGGTGPSHNIYVGSGGDISTLTISNSISEQANNGYELKTRAKNTILNCNIFRGDIDVVNNHSSDIHIAGGRESHITNNLIYEGAAVRSFSFAYFFLWGGDLGSDPILTNNLMVATNNYFIEDYSPNSGARHIFSIRNDLPPPSPSPPYTIGPNSYVFAGPWSGSPTLAEFSLNNGTMVFSPGSTIYATRTEAGIPNVTYPIPPACTGTIGNVAIP
jgi:hypothetical protein